MKQRKSQNYDILNKHRQKMLEIFNYFGEIFNGQTKEGKELKILTPNQMLVDYQLL